MFSSRIRAFCKTPEKFIPRSTARSLSQSASGNSFIDAGACGGVTFAGDWNHPDLATSAATFQDRSAISSKGFLRIGKSFGNGISVAEAPFQIGKLYPIGTIFLMKQSRINCLHHYSPYFSPALFKIAFSKPGFTSFPWTGTLSVFPLLCVKYNTYIRICKEQRSLFIVCLGKAGQIILNC